MVKISTILGASTLVIAGAATLPISKITEALEGSITTLYSSDLTR